MSTELLTILPNLSIGVISILGLIFVVVKFLEALDKRTEQHAEAMKEREGALRSVEKEVRNNILSQLSKNTEIMNDTSKVMERAIMILDRGK